MTRADDGTVRIYRPDGTLVPSAPPATAVGPNPLGTLLDAQASLGLDPETARPTWDGSPVDYDLAVTGLMPRPGAVQ